MTKTIFFVLLLTSTTFLLSSEDKSMDVPFIEERVKIDGELNESFYKDLKPVDGFYQYHPQNGAKPTFKTLVYTFYDKKNVYFSFKCFDDDPEKITGDVTPFGGYSNNDEVKVYIDTYLDKRTYKVFAVNPRGILNGEQTVWNASAGITDDGWSAEFKIPFKSLRFPVKDIQHWNVNFQRFIFRLNETCYWTKVERDMISVFGDTFGKLEGIKKIKGGKNLEIYPYAGYRGSRSGDVTDNKFAYGLDLKYGITSNLTLDFTSSPDYSEVESDPFFYQLEPYEVNLEENRPFYSESSSFFSTPFQLFYSRRITDPTLAAKVTGKEKGYSLGALIARNNREGSPEAYHGVFRLKKDIFKLSHIGVMYSSIEEKGNWNRNAGIDFSLTFKDIYRLEGMAAFSFNKDLPNSKNGMYKLNFARMADKGLILNGWLESVGPNAEVPAGFLRKVDYNIFYIESYYSFRWEGKWLERLILLTRFAIEESIERKLKCEETYFVGIDFLTRNRFWFSVRYRWGKFRGHVFDEAGKLVWDEVQRYPHKLWFAGLAYEGSSMIQGGIETMIWDDFVYNESFTATKAGKRFDLFLWVNFKISPQLQLRINYSKNNNKSDDGTIRFKGDLISSRLNYQISKKLSTFLKFQYDSYLERFQYDFIIGYEPANVSKIIFSIKNYSEHRFRVFDPDARSLAFKVSYLYRF